MASEPLISQFVGDLEKVVSKYAVQGLTNAEAIGGLEMVKHAKLADILSEDEDDDLPPPPEEL